VVPRGVVVGEEGVHRGGGFIHGVEEVSSQELGLQGLEEGFDVTVLPRRLRSSVPVLDSMLRKPPIKSLAPEAAVVVRRDRSGSSIGFDERVTDLDDGVGLERGSQLGDGHAGSPVDEADGVQLLFPDVDAAFYIELQLFQPAVLPVRVFDSPLHLYAFGQVFSRGLFGHADPLFRQCSGDAGRRPSVRPVQFSDRGLHPSIDRPGAFRPLRPGLQQPIRLIPLPPVVEDASGDAEGSA